MNQKKAKSLRKLARMFANDKTKGLLHPGKVELFKKDGLDVSKEKDDKWYIRIFLRQYAHDSRQKLNRIFKRLYTRHKLDTYFLKRMPKPLHTENHA